MSKPHPPDQQNDDERTVSSKDADDLRPLPHSGLEESMPDWLRRPPAWRGLDRPEKTTTERQLPPPDTSVIDPRTLIGIEDLPPWLQRQSGRTGDAASVAREQGVSRAIPEGEGDALVSDAPSRTDHPPESVSPHNEVSQPSERSDAVAAAPPDSEPVAIGLEPFWKWWQRPWVVLLLIIVVLIVAGFVLVATGGIDSLPPLPWSIGRGPR